MKKFVILLIFCLPVFGFGQNVSAIRKQVEIINNSKNYVVKKISNDYFVDVKNEVTDNGQELEGFYTRKELKKIVHSVGLSNQEIVTQFYFNHNDLIFVLRKKFQTIDNEGQYIEPKLISESRFYFVNGNVINQNEKIDQKEVSDIKLQSTIFQNDLKAYK
ncbi:hypothetical protein LUD75_09065 [Epilithonimonas sp. JDS]|uniref:hypothetical protein n=1 Tax=Epilithonimonas sp. JDS TaxID=2902797 RepID=UPI001E4CE1C6|nr:hypothetical protein [Epilithonimonas sp. JDS]MCD9854854.1 hypothetical protein [Epilithonimonas sp. JDS]